jgi:hypothetical protein
MAAMLSMPIFSYADLRATRTRNLEANESVVECLHENGGCPRLFSTCVMTNSSEGTNVNVSMAPRAMTHGLHVATLMSALEICHALMVHIVWTGILRSSASAPVFLLFSLSQPTSTARPDVKIGKSASIQRSTNALSLRHVESYLAAMNVIAWKISSVMGLTANPSHLS